MGARRTDAGTGTGTGADPRVWLHLRGISYYATVYLNGAAITPVQAPTTSRLQGMYHRWSFDLGKLSALTQLQGTAAPTMSVRVEPPEYVGAGCHACKDPPCLPCGQGGDHQIAKNAAMMQFTQGWDWVQPTPDRNTVCCSLPVPPPACCVCLQAACSMPTHLVGRVNCVRNRVH